MVQQRQSSTPNQSYKGFVGTRTRVPNKLGYNWFGAVTKHYATDHIVGLTAGWAHFYINTANGSYIETSAPAVGQLIASVEYPKGTWNRMVFSGSKTGVLVPGAVLYNDECEVDIPQGAEFALWTSGYSANGMPYYDSGMDGFHGETLQYGGSLGPDYTDGSGTYAYSDGQSGANIYPPCLLLGTTTKSSVIVFGDSRVGGFQDTFNDTSHAIGHFDRAMSKEGVGHANTGIPGDRLLIGGSGGIGNSNSMRLPLAQCASHVVLQHGINDIQQGATGASLFVAQQSIASKLGGKRIAVATLEPVSSSTDSWATTGNQTTSPYDAERQKYNALVRKGAPWFDLCVDVASVLEYGSTGLWNAGTLTADGIHCNAAGAMAVRNADVYSPAFFRSRL